jgi:hypothetical protein
MPEAASLAEHLDRLRALEEAAYHRVDPDWRIDLRPPADQGALNQIESQLERQLSKDAVELYRWHDGSDGGTWFVPFMHFHPLHVALEIYQSVADLGAFAVSNAPDKIDVVDLFPVFQHERILLSVRLTHRRRSETSPLYVIDFEDGQLTEAARTLRSFVDHLIELFERGEYEADGRELRWTAPPYRVEPDPEPYGSGS